MSTTQRRRNTPHRSKSGFLTQWVLPLCLVVAGGLLVGKVRAGLAESFHTQKSAENQSLLLPPEYTVMLSLGHREALADYLYGTALVDYGLSFVEKRAYKNAYRVLDTITTLAPQFLQPYLFAETLLTLQTTPASAEKYRQTFALHDRGMQALPYVTEMWFTAGQFAAYMAKGGLPKREHTAARLRGARLLARACELANNDENIPFHCLNAAKMLNRAGHQEAVIRMLTRTLAVNDDPEIRMRALNILRRTMGERERDRQERRIKELEKEWKKSTGFTSRTMISLLGPSPDAWRCVGPAASRTVDCVSSWRAWSGFRFSED